MATFSFLGPTSLKSSRLYVQSSDMNTTMSHRPVILRLFDSKAPDCPQQYPKAYYSPSFVILIYEHS